MSSIAHDSVTLSWDDPDDATITGYQILRRNPGTQENGLFTVVEDDTATASTTYTNTTVEPSSTYLLPDQGPATRPGSVPGQGSREPTCLPRPSAAAPRHRLNSATPATSYFASPQATTGTLDNGGGGTILPKDSLEFPQ